MYPASVSRRYTCTMKRSLFARGQYLLVFIFANIIIFSLFLVHIGFARVFKRAIRAIHTTRQTEYRKHRRSNAEEKLIWFTTHCYTVIYGRDSQTICAHIRKNSCSISPYNIYGTFIYYYYYYCFVIPSSIIRVCIICLCSLNSDGFSKSWHR